MKILLVTTRNDRSKHRIVEEAEARNINVSLWFYEDIVEREITKSTLLGFDFYIFRDPYNAGTDFSPILRKLLYASEPSRTLDYNTYTKYPLYEDKMFQHKIFKGIVPMPKTWKPQDMNNVPLSKFPLILKKRIGSRGKGVFVIYSRKEIRDFFRDKNIDDYFLEEYLNVKRDIRIIVIGNEIIGAVERRVRLKDNSGYRGIGVKVKSVCEVSEHIKAKSIQISKAIECDFCGIDFVIDDKGNAFLLECNISPQFVSFERISNINVASSLIEYMLNTKRN